MIKDNNENNISLLVVFPHRILYKIYFLFDHYISNWSGIKKYIKIFFKIKNGQQIEKMQENERTRLPRIW